MEVDYIQKILNQKPTLLVLLIDGNFEHIVG